MNGVINAALSEAPPERAGDSAVLVTLFATRSVDAEATTGLAANGHMMMVGESGEEPPFDADPRATRPSQWVAVEEAVAKCVSKPREGVGLRGGWVVPFSSGSGVRVPQRQRKRHQPRRAAPFGASCDERPRIRPYKVVAPKGAARRRLGSAFALRQPDAYGAGESRSAHFPSL